MTSIIASQNLHIWKSVRLSSTRALRWTSHLKPSRYLSAGDWLPEIRYLPYASNSVAISLDDGPTPETTPRILELLAQYHAKATFFLSGVRAAKHPDLVQAIVDANHDVYGHGWDHIHYDETGPERLVRDVDRCESYLGRFRPTPSPYLVRLPYTAGHRCAWAHRALRDWSPTVQLAHYSVALNDWLLAKSCDTCEDIENKAEMALARLRYDRLAGKVVLLHESAFDAASRGDSKQEWLNAAVGPILLKVMLAQLERWRLNATNVKPLNRQSAVSRYVLTPRRKIVIAW